MKWSSYSWSYLIPYWRVCIIDEVAGNLSAKGRRVTEGILIMLPPSLFQGISWGWHFVRLRCLRIMFQLNGECSEMFHFCVLRCVCASEGHVSSNTQGHPAMQICPCNFQMRVGSCPTISECGQNKFLPDSKPQRRHTHSGFVRMSLAWEGGFKPACKLWKAGAECTVSGLFKALPQLNWLLNICGFSFWAVR